MAWLLSALALFSPLLVLLADVPTKDASGLDAWRLIAWLASAAGYAGLLAVWGLGSKGTVFGIVIDRRNRMSLSRFQIVLWTLLVLPTITVALFGNVLRAPDVAGIVAFEVEWSLVALMGLSVGSFLAAPAALSLKARRDADPAEVNIATERLAASGASPKAKVRVEGQVIGRDSAEEASLGDLVLGEETGNAGTLDIARAQMLAITVVVWVVYLATVLRQFGTYGPEMWQIQGLKPFSDTLLTLILVSHGGYISGKVIPNSAKPRERAARDLAKALDLRQRLQALLGELSTVLKTSHRLAPVEEKQLGFLSTQVKRLISATDPLPNQIGAGADLASTLSNLEGQLESVHRCYLGVVSEGSLPGDVDDPPRELVRELKRGLNEAGYGPVQPVGPWSDDDDAALDRLLADVGLRRGDLDGRRYRAFEEALGLIEAVKAG